MNGLTGYLVEKSLSGEFPFSRKWLLNLKESIDWGGGKWSEVAALLVLRCGIKAPLTTGLCFHQLRFV
jgi:hypothetical protein